MVQAPIPQGLQGSPVVFFCIRGIVEALHSHHAGVSASSWLLSKNGYFFVHFRICCLDSSYLSLVGIGGFWPRTPTGKIQKQAGQGSPFRV